MQKLFEILKFDSELFGFGVAKIIPTKLTMNELLSLFQELKFHQVKLVYWCSDLIDDEMQHIVKEKNGLLVDEKVTYVVDLNTINPEFLTIDSNIKDYDKNPPDEKLIDIGSHAGDFSRFKIDPKISPKLCKKMYASWIKNSVNRTLAQHVFVYYENDNMAGMITLGEKNSRGDIGLLAVDAKHKGKKIGTKLVRAAQKQFRDEGYSISQVVTQKANQTACKLYASCGYSLEKTECFYHFWL